LSQIPTLCNTFSVIEQINDKFARWIVILQEYDLEFSTPKSKKALVLTELVMALPSDTTSAPVNTDFPDEHLFYITSDDPWYGDLLVYLRTQNLVTTFHEMIVVVFAIRPPATSSSETSYTGGESTPFFIDA
jgi:hypothetical protein